MALQLMQAGYSRVSVVRGGLPALMAAGVEVAPKDVPSDFLLPPAGSDGKTGADGPEQPPIY